MVRRVWTGVLGVVCVTGVLLAAGAGGGAGAGTTLPGTAGAPAAKLPGGAGVYEEVAAAEALDQPLKLTFRINGIEALPALALETAARRFNLAFNIDPGAGKNGAFQIKGEIRPGKGSKMLLAYHATLDILSADKSGGLVVSNTTVIEPGKTSRLLGIDAGEIVVEVAPVE